MTDRVRILEYPFAQVIINWFQVPELAE